MRSPLPLLLLMLVACPPPCKQVCKKVLFECSLDSERLALDACEENCERQEFLYKIWDDEVKQDLFDDHKRCIKRSTCDEIAEGVCYEDFEDLFLFDVDKILPPVSQNTPQTTPTGSTASDTGTTVR